MAKKVQFHVSFSATCGASSEVLEGLEEMRTALREQVDQVGIEAVLARSNSGHHLIRKMADPQVDIEEVLVCTVKAGLRAMLEEHREDRKDGNFQRIGDISITQVNKIVRAEPPKVCSRCEVVKKTTSHTQCETCRSCSEVV